MISVFVRCVCDHRFDPRGGGGGVSWRRRNLKRTFLCRMGSPGGAAAAAPCGEYDDVCTVKQPTPFYPDKKCVDRKNPQEFAVPLALGHSV